MNDNVTDAVVARLVARLPADIKIYDGIVNDSPPARYVIVYGDIGRRSSSTVDGLSRDQTYSVQCMGVVTAPMSTGHCRWVCTAIREALTDWRPDAADVVPGQFVHETSRRPVDNETVPDRHVLFGVELFSLFADRR